ncbi:MAG: hypothetical protein ACOYMF_06085 [Bacteroidales bacterium]
MTNKSDFLKRSPYRITIKHDDNLIKLASHMRITPEAYAMQLIEAGIRTNMFLGEECEFGLTLMQHYEAQGVSKDDAIDYIITTAKLSRELAEAALKLTTVGFGDCPECGGDCEIIAEPGRWINTDSRETPPEYIAYWQELTCSNCYFTFTRKE